MTRASNARLGKHNREIYGGVFGLSDGEIDALKADDII
jgi:hypothetical protein|tara:strand:- start:203 stop:316 length:114 start_codon:yes stop_codon:yes gene_type:complete